MKLLRTYVYIGNNGRARWIEFHYNKNRTMDLWKGGKLETCPKDFDYTPERAVPIGLNPFQR